jgi:hypothetical protein
MDAQVVAKIGPRAVRTKVAKRPRTTKQRAGRQEAASAVGLGAVACVLTGLSLSHLAHGVQDITHCSPWEGWAMGVGIDLNFVGMEMVTFTAAEKVRKAVSKYTTPAKARRS